MSNTLFRWSELGGEVFRFKPRVNTACEIQLRGESFGIPNLAVFKALNCPFDPGAIAN